MNALREWFSGIDLEWIITNGMVVLAAVISLTFHECAHAFAAYKLGDDTAKQMGRLTLNPLKHLSWSGLLMLAIFKFGWAKPVPIDMRRFENPKGGMAITALAGPLSNVLLALLSCFLLNGLIDYGYRHTAWAALNSRSALSYVFSFFYILALLNAGLAVFNLIPISPLDGSKVLAVILPDEAYAWLMRYERYGMPVLMVLLLTDVLDKPLAFLRSGLLEGLFWLARLPFPQIPNLFSSIF